MAGENFVGGVNALYGRLDQNVRENQLDPVKMIASQNALQKQAYELGATKRALEQDEAVRNALSGVGSMDDVRNAIPKLYGADPSFALKMQTGLDTAESTRLLRQAQIQKALGVETDPVKAMKSAFEIRTKLIPALLSNSDPLGAYSNVYAQLEAKDPRMVSGWEHPSNFRGNQQAFAQYLDDADFALQPLASRLTATTPRYTDVTGVDEQGNPTTQKAGYMPGTGLGGLTPVTPAVPKLGQRETPFSQFNKGFTEKYFRENGTLPTDDQKAEAWKNYQIEMAGGRAEAGARGRNIGSVDPAAVEFASDQLLAGNTMAMGRGVQMLQAVYKRAQEKLDAMGGSPDQVATAKNIRKSYETSLNSQEKNLGAMGSFVKNISKQVDRADEIMADIDRLGIRAFDVPWRDIKTRGIGDAQEKILEAYTAEISREINKLVQGSQASIAQLPVEEAKKWDRIHDVNLSLPELKKVLAETKNMAQMRYESTTQERDLTRSYMDNISSRYGAGEKQQSANPKGRLTATQAQEYLRRAGGDKTKARELAKAEGWEF